MPLIPQSRPRLFAVMFEEANPEAIKLLEDAYSMNYKLKDGLYLIKTTDLAQKVSKTVGIKGENRIVSGAVFRLNHIYAGYYNSDLWDWLGEDDS